MALNKIVLMIFLASFLSHTELKMLFNEESKRRSKVMDRYFNKELAMTKKDD